MSSPAPGFDFRGAIENALITATKAIETRDAAAFASLYAEDATLLPPGAPPIKGKTNIQAFWQAFFDAGASDAQLRFVQIESSGDIAYEIGAYDATVPNAQGGTERSSGKYLVVWRRQGEDGLKIVADMFSPNS